jgi:hypothetical protein
VTGLSGWLITDDAVSCGVGRKWHRRRLCFGNCLCGSRDGRHSDAPNCGGRGRNSRSGCWGQCYWRSVVFACEEEACRD